MNWLILIAMAGSSAFTCVMVYLLKGLDDPFTKKRFENDES